MQLPTTSAQPLRLIAPKFGASAQHIPVVDVQGEGTCAICSATDRVAREPIENAQGVEDASELSLPLCGTCARAQIRAMGFGWWIAIAGALVPGAVVAILCLREALPLWSVGLLTVGLLAAGFIASDVVIRKLRERAVPILRVANNRLQVPSLSGDGSAPARMKRQLSVGYILGSLVVIVAIPLVWSGSMPTLILDNPRSESCWVQIDNDAKQVLSFKSEITTRAHASEHQVVLQCGAASPVAATINGKFGQAVLVSTDANECYTSQHDATVRSVGAVYSSTLTTRGTVQYPLTTPVSRSECGRPSFR